MKIKASRSVSASKMHWIMPKACYEQEMPSNGVTVFLRASTYELARGIILLMDEILYHLKSLKSSELR